jgi:hypothetical protein
MGKRGKKLLLSVVLIAVVSVGTIGHWLQKQQSLPGESSISISRSAPLRVSPVPRSTHTSSNSIQSNSSPHRDSEWAQFTEKFGSNLRAEFAENGQLVSVQGQIDSGNATVSGFRPQDPQKAIDRAQDIVAAAQKLLGVKNEWPLGKPVTQGSPISAQVFMTETYRGMRVAPVGSLKVDLGPQGELLALYSNYASEVRVTNEAVLSSAEAQIKALSVVNSPQDTAVRVDGGEKVVWVTGNEGRIAYQFMVRGREVIVDAQTGKILHSRDKRQF